MNPTLWHNGKWVKSEGFCTELFIQQAMLWSHKESEKPFFAFIPLNVAHKPWTVKQEWRETLKLRGVPDNLIDFYALIEDMDQQIGRLLKSIDRENTIIWFMSDNGTAGRGYNAGMKGRKGSVHEGGCVCLHGLAGKVRLLQICKRVIYLAMLTFFLPSVV